jgi:hypothetical protein
MVDIKTYINTYNKKTNNNNPFSTSTFYLIHSLVLNNKPTNTGNLTYSYLFHCELVKHFPKYQGAKHFETRSGISVARRFQIWPQSLLCTLHGKDSTPHIL